MRGYSHPAERQALINGHVVDWDDEGLRATTIGRMVRDCTPNHVQSHPRVSRAKRPRELQPC